MLEVNLANHHNYYPMRAQLFNKNDLIPIEKEQLFSLKKSKITIGKNLLVKTIIRVCLIRETAALLEIDF
jgi:hypothetical protein